MAGRNLSGRQVLGGGLVAIAVLMPTPAHADTSAVGEGGSAAIGSAATGNAAVRSAAAPDDARLDPRADLRVRTLLTQQAGAARRLAATQIAHVRTRFPGVQDAEARCRRGLTASAPTSAAASSAPGVAGDARAAPPPGLDARAAAPVSLPIATCERDLAGAVWTEGSMEVGAGQPRLQDESFGFRSRGLTFGSERRVGGGLVVGVGMGWAREQADASADGTSNAAEALSGVLYLSYRPSAGFFVDALAGHASLRMRSARPLGDRSRLAAGRGGSESFAVVAAGFRSELGGIDVAPYTRFESMRATLHGTTEGAGALDALHFERQNLPAWKLALGIEGASRIDTPFGLLRPRASVEARHELEGAGSAGIAYADAGGGLYTMESQGVPRQSLLLGLGATLSLPDRWSLAAGYSVDHAAQARSTRVDLTLSRHLP